MTTEAISWIKERSRRRRWEDEHQFFDTTFFLFLCSARTSLNSCGALKLVFFDGNSSGHRPATTLPSLRVGIPGMALHDAVMWEERGQRLEGYEI